MIRIGLTPCFMYPDESRPTFSKKSLSYAENDMVDFISHPGVLPILIPQLKEERLEEFVSELDGIVFQGGSDVAPSSYGEEAIENNRWPGDPVRDEYELKIMTLAQKRKIPILGICRGMQILNVYYKGSLYQDLAVEAKIEREHRNAEIYDKNNHSVSVKKDSLLFEIYQKEELKVNSVHHQGVKTLGQGLVAESYSSEDNLVEAFRHENMDDQFVWAVQWHPEFSHTLKDQIDSSEAIIDKFIKKVIEKKNENK